MNYTNEELLTKGIWNCLECGHLNTLDQSRCGKCYEDKFIMKKAHAPKWRHSEDYKTEPAKRVIEPIYKFHFKKPMAESIKGINKVNPYRNIIFENESNHRSYER